MRQQCPGATGPFLDPLMATPGERAVTGKMMIALRLRYIDKLLAARIWPVERNKICCHCLNIAGFAGCVERRARTPAKLAVSIAGINRRSRNKPATKLFLCVGQLSTSFRGAGSPLTMPQGFRP